MRAPAIHQAWTNLSLSLFLSLSVAFSYAAYIIMLRWISHLGILSGILIDFNGRQINCDAANEDDADAAKRSAENVVILNSIMNT